MNRKSNNSLSRPQTPMTPITPTTPSTGSPHTPIFSRCQLPGLDTYFSPVAAYQQPSPLSPCAGRTTTSRSSLATATFNHSMRRRNSSIVSSIEIPSSPLETAMQRPLPVRAPKMARTSNSGKKLNPLRLQTHQVLNGGIMLSNPLRRRKSKERLRARSPPPTYHVTVPQQQQQRERSRQFNTADPTYIRALETLSTPLVPLISVSTGQAHPEFPRSLLQYHLLTHEQLDDLSRWYHQVIPPVKETWRYPCAVPGWVSASHSNMEENSERRTSLSTKRRRWGRFMGLRGCDTPISPTIAREGAEEMLERMERDWKRAMEASEEERRMEEKSWRGRW